MKAIGLGLRALWIGAIVAVAVGLTIAYFAVRPTIVRHATGRVVQTAGPDFDPIRSDEIHTILAEDAIPAINPPVRYLPAGTASDIRDDEDVIGLVIGIDARAFPVATLSAHEIVNDVIGGQGVAVTW